MKENENYLVRTTFDEIASDVDEEAQQNLP